MRRHRFALLVAVSAFLLVIAGSLVTTTGSALAVPDWPLAFGQAFPRMEGGVLYEHGHRMIAGVVVILVLALEVWTELEERRPAVRWLARAMAFSILVQALLGGLTVLLRLPVAISVSHAAVAELLFAMTVVMADMTASRESRVASRDSDAGSARGLSRITVVAVFLQILLGAVVRHTGAGLAIPTFPLANGRLIPEFTTVLVAWNFAHRVGAVVVTVLVTWTAVANLRGAPPQGPPLQNEKGPDEKGPAIAMLILIAWQLVMGALTILTWRGLLPTTAHVAGGALLFATSVLLALRSARQPAPIPGASPLLAAA
jgi:heme A synthase